MSIERATGSRRGAAMHTYGAETEIILSAVMSLVSARISGEPELNRTISSSAMDQIGGETICPQGLGVERAIDVFKTSIVPNTIATDHPAYLSYIPTAPTYAAALFDLVVSTSGMIGSGWIDGGGAIWAENQALRWLCQLAGYGDNAGGCFVSGGSAGNLSALAAARHVIREQRGQPGCHCRVLVAEEAHASIIVAARLLGIDAITVPTDACGRLTREAVMHVLRSCQNDLPVAVVATAGTTNAGAIDELDGIADACRSFGVWLHVDAAYGGAALTSLTLRAKLRGIEKADSVVIDPHKWLFAPYDCCALLYADPSHAAAAFTQDAVYLDSAHALAAWNPMDYAFHLTRRPRGLPFWFSLAVHGTDAYRDAIEAVMSIAIETVKEINQRKNLELVMEPDLSVLLFRRIGWKQCDYENWSLRLLREQVAFVLPTNWKDETVVRLCIVNPLTDFTTITMILDSLR